MGGTRGRRITLPQRENAIALIDEACKSGARKDKACEILGISLRTIQRWCIEEGTVKEDGRSLNKRTPENKLSDTEYQSILDICNSPSFQSLPPNQIVPALADRGRYIASESTFYRTLKNEGQLKHRGKSNPRANKRPESYIATGPNQVWTWDITYLPSSVKGLFYYLYMIVDIYSRKIVGWEIHDEQSDIFAAKLVRKACLVEGIAQKGLVLHSDNGSPMKGATMLATLQKLGVATSFNRPGVSNDNPYSEALFKTLKYRPGYPNKPFNNLTQSRDWVLEFVRWYNKDHKHSSIKYVTPEQRHNGEDAEVLRKRKQVYEEAKSNNPERWSRKIRNWDAIGEVHLNRINKDKPTGQFLEAA